MLNNVKPEILDYASSFSNWLDLMLNYTNSFFEVAVIGKNVYNTKTELNKHYIPNKLVAGSKSKNKLPLLINRYKEEETYIYVCVNNTCKQPTNSITEALTILKSWFI